MCLSVDRLSAALLEPKDNVCATLRSFASHVTYWLVCLSLSLLSVCLSVCLSIYCAVCLCSHVLRTVQRHRPLVINAASQPAVFSTDALPHAQPAQQLSRSDLLVPANPYLQTGQYMCSQYVIIIIIIITGKPRAGA